MATSRAQQIGIWIIAVVLTVGTIGGFVAIVLANENQAEQQATQQADYEKQIEEYAKQQLAANEPLEGYAAEPFDAAAVTDLKVEVLEEGTGEAVKASDTIKASYFGWLSDGTIFDSSNKKEADDEPVSFPLTGVIEGWTKGLEGQKVGSTVKLTIPAEMAYGSQERPTIPANSPLTFIVTIHSIEPAESA